ncbi:MAG: hypothetical protein ACLP0J_14085 [Solirubrobacteraceae bacterium]
MLNQAAQAALRIMSVVPGQDQYGFVKVRIRSVVGGGIPTVGTQLPTWNAWLRTSEIKSDWYRADGSGRERIVRASTEFLTPHDRATALAHGMTLAQLMVWVSALLRRRVCTKDSPDRRSSPLLADESPADRARRAGARA